MNDRDLINLKIGIVGSNKSGKTSLIRKLINKEITEHSILTNQSYEVIVNQTELVYKITLWDTSHKPENKKIRSLTYENCHTYIICFAIDDFSSYEDALNYWYYEIRDDYMNCPIIFVGNKSDLRENKENECIIYETAKKNLELMGDKYIEVNTITNQGISDLMDEIVSSSMEYLMFITENSKKENIFRFDG